MKYFNPIPKTCEELKKLYHALALKHHPDLGGDTEVMKIINGEYDILFDQLRNVHQNAKGETYTSSKPNQETPEYFKDIINKIIHFEGIKIEIIGSFIWISENTYPYKDKLKEIGFKWHSTKRCWYLAPEDYVKHSKVVLSLEEIRKLFGSQEVETITTEKLYS